MANSISFLPPPPNRAPMMDKGVNATNWQTWFTQMWLFMRGGTFVSSTGDASMVANTAYTSFPAALTTYTLPTRFAVGDTFQVIGSGAGGWVIAQNALQQIFYPPTATSVGVGGSIASTNRYDTVTLQAIYADTTLSVVAQTGTLTVT